MTTRVLHLLDVLRPSGAETTLVVAGPRWAALGVDADVLATGEALGGYAPQLRAAGYRTGRLPLDPFSRFVPRFRQLLQAEGYDVVHNHVERANAYVAAVARSAGVQVVQSLHGLWDFSGPARLERTVGRRAMRAMGVRFVAVSDAVRRNEAERFANPTTVITNWIDDRVHHFATTADRQAARAQLSIDGDRSVITTVGNCSTIKNHDALVRAMGLLGRSDVIYLHAGTGEEEVAERRLVEEVGLSQQVRFLGFTEPSALLRAADLFVMPSLHEGQGIAAVEALATGTPTLLADSEGLRTLADLDLPITWAPPTPEGLAHGLRTCLADPPDAAALQQAAAVVAERFGPDGPLSAMAELYRGD